MNAVRINQQLWTAKDFFEPDQWQSIKLAYRRSRVPFSMQYDDRLLTPWSDTPELQQIVEANTERVSQLVGLPLAPQVAYVSIDLAGSSIMMHRLHPDILVQVQIGMGEESDCRMAFCFCHDSQVNAESELDYQPLRRLTRHDVDVVNYEPNLASIYVNEPRGFCGMLSCVPGNIVREVLILSYTRAY
jgi:hypothetical protein